jgi:hypothetical protein
MIGSTTALRPSSLRMGDRLAEPTDYFPPIDLSQIAAPRVCIIAATPNNGGRRKMDWLATPFYGHARRRERLKRTASLAAVRFFFASHFGSSSKITPVR